MDLAAYILAIMVWILPPAKGVAAAKYVPEASETVEERAERYAEIASDMATVIEAELTGDSSRRQMAATLLAVTYHESGWHKHVDYGIGKKSKGDNGRSWCLAQINLGTGATPEGWFGQDLVDDRRKCLTAAVRTIRRSFNVCSHLPLHLRLSSYASGSCLRGRAASERRMYTATRMMGRWRQLSESAGDGKSPGTARVGQL